MSSTAARPTEVVQDPDSGLWLLPTGSGNTHLSRWLPSWDDLHDAQARLLLDVLRTASAQDRAAGRPPRDRVLTRVLGLLPVATDYSPDSVAVVIPPKRGRPLDPEQQVAWVKHDHLASLRPSIVGLSTITGASVGFQAKFELTAFEHEAWMDDDQDFLDGYRGPDVPAWEQWAVVREHGYEIEGPRGDIAGWAEVRAAVLALRASGPARILPMVARRGTWAVPPAHPTRVALCEARDVELVLHADDQGLRAMHGDQVVSVLVPHRRDFFERTWAQVLEFGGTAPVQAQTHTGSLEIWVEDDRSTDGTVYESRMPRRWPT